MKPYQRLVTQASSLSGSSHGTDLGNFTVNAGISGGSNNSTNSNSENGNKVVAPRTLENVIADSAATVVSTQGQSSVAHLSSMVTMGIPALHPTQLSFPSAPFQVMPAAAPSQNFQHPSHVENHSSGKILSMSLNEKRKGKWTDEEKAYSDRLIEEFKNGTLTDCENNTTLRSYLMKKLHCDNPMRITKKYAGLKIGKLVFVAKPQIRRCVAETADRLSLEELELSFHRSILGSNITAESGSNMLLARNAMVRANGGYSQNQSNQLPQPMTNQTHLPSYSLPSTTSAAGLSAPLSAPSQPFGQSVTLQGSKHTSSEGGTSLLGETTGVTQDGTHALHKAYLAALSESKTNGSMSCNSDPVESDQRSLTGTGAVETERHVQSRNNASTASSEHHMDMHKLIPGLLNDASSVMLPMGAAYEGNSSVPASIPPAGFPSFSHGFPPAQAQPIQQNASQSTNRVPSAAMEYQTPEQKSLSVPTGQKTDKIAATGEPSPAITGTETSIDSLCYPTQMTADEYVISAQATAIAVSQHSAYSFCESQSLPDHLMNTNKSKRQQRLSDAHLNEHHKRPRLDCFAPGISRGAHFVSASEKSSEMGTESESVLASSDFGSENGSDNASANSEGGS